MSFPANQPFKVMWDYDPAMLQYVSRFDVHWRSMTDYNLSGMVHVPAPTLECTMAALGPGTYDFSVNAIPTADVVQQMAISPEIQGVFVSDSPPPVPTVTIPVATNIKIVVA